MNFWIFLYFWQKWINNRRIATSFDNKKQGSKKQIWLYSTFKEYWGISLIFAIAKIISIV